MVSVWVRVDGGLQDYSKLITTIVDNELNPFIVR